MLKEPMAQKTIYINSRFQDSSPFLEQIPSLLTTQGRVVQDGRNLIKVLTLPDGTEVNVKRYHKPHGINTMVYSLGLRKPKGARAYLHAVRLMEHGFETPEPVAYIEERKRGLLEYSYFVSLQCPYRHKMYEWGNAEEGTYEDFAKAFGRYSARLHEAGILHRDYTPGNVLWEQCGEEYRFSLVDINQMDFGPVSWRKGCRNICKFWGPKRFVALVAEAYADARGFDVEKTVKNVMQHRQAFWKRYARKHSVITFNLEM